MVTTNLILEVKEFLCHFFTKLNIFYSGNKNLLLCIKNCYFIKDKYQNIICFTYLIKLLQNPKYN